MHMIIRATSHISAGIVRHLDPETAVTTYAGSVQNIGIFARGGFMEVLFKLQSPVMVEPR